MNGIIVNVNTDTLPTKANEIAEWYYPAVTVNHTCMLLNKYNYNYNII